MEGFLLTPSLVFLWSRSVSSGRKGVFAVTQWPAICSRAVRLAQGKALVTIRGMGLRRDLPRSPYRQCFMALSSVTSQHRRSEHVLGAEQHSGHGEPQQGVQGIRE